MFTFFCVCVHVSACACECMYMCVFMLGVFFSQFHLIFFQLNFLVCVCWSEGGHATVHVQRSGDSPVELVLFHPVWLLRIELRSSDLCCRCFTAEPSYHTSTFCFVFETVSYWSWSSLTWLAGARVPPFSASPVLRLQICTAVPNFFHMFWGAKPMFLWCSQARACQQ